MAGSSVNKVLHELLDQQRRDSERLKQQHQRDQQLQQQQWRKEDLALRQQQRYEQQMVQLGQRSQRESLRHSQRSTRGMLEQHAQMGLPGQVMMQLVKQDKALWDKLSKQQQKKLEQAAGSGATGGELLRLLERQQKKEARQQSRLHQGERRTVKEHHEEQRLGGRQTLEEQRHALHAMHRSEQRKVQEQHGGERLATHEKIREEQQHRQKAERAKKREELHRQQQLGHIKAAGGSLLHGDIRGVVGNLGKLGAVAGAAAAGIQMLDKGVKSYYSAIERGQFSQEKFGLNVRHMVEETVPGYGEWLKHQGGPGAEHNKTDNAVHNFLARNNKWLSPVLDPFGMYLPTKETKFKGPGKSTIQRQLEAFQAQQGIGIASAQAQAEMGAFSHQSALRMQLTGAGAQQRFGLGFRRAQHGITGLTLGTQEAAIRGVQGQTGYGRHEQVEDIFRQIQHARSMATISEEGKAKLGVIGAKQTETAGRQTELQTKHQQAQREHAALVQKHEAHIKSGGLVSEEVNLRKQVTAAYEKQQAIAQQLATAQKQGLDLRLEREQAIYQIQEKQHTALRSQVEALGQAIQKEQQRKRDLTENLALMHPRKLMTLVGMERKFKAGMPMTQRDIGLMQQHPELFRGQLQQIAARRAQQGPFAGAIQELMRNTGQGRREQELRQQKVALENHIKIQVQLDEKGLARGWIDQVEKAFNNIASQIKHQMDVRLNEIENRRMTQQRQQFPHV